MAPATRLASMNARSNATSSSSARILRQSHCVLSSLCPIVLIHHKQIGGMGMTDERGRLVVSGLTKRFGPVRAVDGLSFSVEPGSVTGFLGPNGAGKSTTLRMLLGLVT